MFQKILLPLDGSETAEAIVPQVRRLLKREPAEVQLLHAVCFVPPIDGYVSTYVPELREHAAEYLGDLVARLQKEGIRAQAVLQDGPAAEVILGYAHEAKVSLIAMATHGRSGLTRWILGSVTEKVLRAAETPLLVVRSFHESGDGNHVAAPLTDLPFRNVLVPLDGSLHSNGILPCAEEFCKLFGSRATLLHVEEPGARHPEKELRGEDAVRAAADRFQSAGIHVDTVIHRGDPAVEILKVSRHRPIDMIAMTTHGRSGFARWMLGSVAEKVIRGSILPILVARGPR